MKTFDMNIVKSFDQTPEDHLLGWYDTWEEYAWAVELENEENPIHAVDEIFRNSENKRENPLDNGKF